MYIQVSFTLRVAKIRVSKQQQHYDQNSRTFLTTVQYSNVKNYVILIKVKFKVLFLMLNTFGGMQFVSQCIIL